MVMTILGFHMPNKRVGFMIGSAVLAVICVALLGLAPTKQSVDQGRRCVGFLDYCPPIKGPAGTKKEVTHGAADRVASA